MLTLNYLEWLIRNGASMIKPHTNEKTFPWSMHVCIYVLLCHSVSTKCPHILIMVVEQLAHSVKQQQQMHIRSRPIVSCALDSLIQPYTHIWLLEIKHQLCSWTSTPFFQIRVVSPSYQQLTLNRSGSQEVHGDQTALRSSTTLWLPSSTAQQLQHYDIRLCNKHNTQTQRGIISVPVGGSNYLSITKIFDSDQVSNKF